MAATLLAAVYCLFIILELYGLRILGAPDLEHVLWNLAVIPAIELFQGIVILGVMLLTLLIFFKIRVVTLTAIFIGLAVLSSLGVAGREFARSNQIEHFWGGISQGRDIPCGIANSNLESFVPRTLEPTVLAGGRMGLSPDGRYAVYFDNTDSRHFVVDRKTGLTAFRLRHWVISSEDIFWLPRSGILLYEYNYDRDDPTKVFAANVRTGETILLGGCSLQ